MKDKSISVLTRREFIRQAACAALGTGALTSAIRDLRFMNAAVAQIAASPITRRSSASFLPAATIPTT